MASRPPLERPGADSVGPARAGDPGTLGDVAHPADLAQHVEQILQQALAQVAVVHTVAELDTVRRGTVGKSGALPAVRRSIASLGEDERRRVGAALTDAQARVTRALGDREEELLDSEPALALPFDVTLPPPLVGTAGLHPTIQMMYDLNDAFVALNFDVYSGPEISSELFEFDHMNFPADHPARESMDTYWLAGSAEDGHETSGAERLCLRPHLTGASIRYMLDHEPPFRFVYPGRVYRNESTDVRHERAFFQYEVLIVDPDLPLS